MLNCPEAAGRRIERRTLHVSMPVRPDLGQSPLAADKGVIRRHLAVLRDAHDLAKVRAKVLRAVPLAISFAQRDKQIAVASEDEPRAEVLLAGHLRHLAEDDLKAGQLRAVKRRAGDGRAVQIAITSFSVRQVDRGIGAEFRIQRDIEQTALSRGKHGGYPRDGFRNLALHRNEAQPPGTLGHQHASIRQEGETPRMLESARNRFQLHPVIDRGR